ncbi:hypothetical protein O6H91_02G124400 [Diphasiastrum complanatum]|uniref:Uncharacterized protein n=8 Tax=Diphasiastrum complanatum TaxID=34168 RepID=A0ACC2EKB1_DIPCM|nr:hypothetical protein O6H91_02G124400 [Diphasiastrum complanatum]KAJ7566926.1 hypothetical protein O6H91_02G124400 [Diphasiastrum complanatum]KAJ7566927.1 hypothetical protein O6H91_02G124400 [Diphasiastrum complanatum]KAJ7566928.1 hypothetical protein O6H91_02G124400 [Diphasiastrum complanatum]KAJ7566929.1 hypothetical protein O6H91_02G124400 [Diphasiastrum complanatum]
MGCSCTKLEVELESPPEKVFTHQQYKRSSGSARVVTTDFFNDILEKDKEKEQTRKASIKQNGSIVGNAATKEQATEKRNERALVPAEPPNPRLSTPPKHLEGEQVAAGWPAWLSAVAGEAIKGWIPRRADSFEKLDKIGQGTYSNVYKARDLDTGKIVALKKVRFDNLEPESVRFMAREFQVLRRLDHPNVIKLEGLVTSRMSCSLYLVFEYMEHDLAGLAACPGIVFTEAQVKCYLQQLLRGLDHCHSRNVLHRDIKGSNLLLDNGGNLKIADFGLATIYRQSQKQAMTSRVVTLWYRPPELLLGAMDYGAAIDLWSTGCILAELLAGKPIMPGRTEVEQLHKIFKLCGSPSEEYWKRSKLPHATIFKPQQPYKRCLSETFKDFPLSALDLIETLLAIEPAERGTAAAALSRDFFTTKPLACDPSSLPQYPPSKELDARIRDEETRRQRAAGTKVSASEAGRRKGTREHSNKAVPAPDANAELPASIQKRRMNSHSAKSKSEKFAPPNGDTAIGFPIDPPRISHPPIEACKLSPTVATHQSGVSNSSSRSGPTVGPGWRKLKDAEIRMAPSRPTTHSAKSGSATDSRPKGHGQSSAADLSSFSNLVAVRRGANDRDSRGEARQQDDTNASQMDFLDASIKKTRSESFRVEGIGLHQPDTFSKQEKGSKVLKTTDSVYQLEQTNREFQQEARATKATLGFQSQSERISYSGPLIHHGGRAAVEIEQLLEDHERKMQQAARRAVHETGKNAGNFHPVVEYGHTP